MSTINHSEISPERQSELRLRKLRQSVLDCSERTADQLKSIDSNIVFSLASLFFTFGVGFVLKVIPYWIPASYFLMLAWFLYSIVSQIGNFRPRNWEPAMKRATDISGRTNEWQMAFSLTTLLRNIWSILMGATFVYTISLVLILLLWSGDAITGTGFTKIAPTITTLSFFILPLLIMQMIDYFERRSAPLDKAVDALIQKGCLLILLFFISFSVSAAVFVALPIYALVEMRILISSNSLPLILLIGVLQLVTVALTASYFSSIGAKKEITNALTNLSRINRRIAQMNIEENSDLGSITQLEYDFVNAKRYDFIVDNSFHFCPFYMLVADQVYYAGLQDKVEPKKDKTS
jgi:hypothetical protein